MLTCWLRHRQLKDPNQLSNVLLGCCLIDQILRDVVLWQGVVTHCYDLPHPPRHVGAWLYWDMGQGKSISSSSCHLSVGVPAGDLLICSLFLTRRVIMQHVYIILAIHPQPALNHKQLL